MRALKIILLVLFLLIAIGGALLWSKRTTIADDKVRAYFNAHQIPVSKLDLIDITTKRVVLGDLELGEGGALRVASATIDFNYSLKSKKLGAAHAVLKGVKANGILSDGKILLGGVERAWDATPVTPNAKATAIAFEGDLDIDRSADGAINAKLANGFLSLAQQQKNLLLPLKLEAQGTGNAERITMTGMFYNDARNIDGTFDGNYDLAAKTGQLKWKTKPISFAPNGFTFAQLSPAYAADFATFATKISVNGKLDMKPESWTVTPRITIYEMPIEALLKEALGEGTKITGVVKGEVPIRVSKDGNWRIEPSDLTNIGGMHIALKPDAAGTALDAHPQAATIKAALGNFEVENMTLKVVSTDDKGGVKMDWHFLGRNPDLLGGKPVDLTLAVTANLRDMWRSAAEVERLTREAERQLRKTK